MTGFWKQLAVCAVLIAAAALGWQYRTEIQTAAGFAPAAGDPSAARAARAEGVPVIVAEVTTMKDDRKVSAIGTGVAAKSVTLRAPSDGVITALTIGPGRRFAKGDVMLELEDADERFAVALAEARLTRATDERDRYRQLEDSGNAATARFEQAETDFIVAEIELDRARDALAKRRLLAPFDGITGLAAVEIGDRITTADRIATLDDRSEILVEFDLPEALLGRIAIDQPVRATTPSAQGAVFEGRISAIDSRVDAATRTARVRAALDNRDDLLRPGASFALALDLPGRQFPAVPELALQFAQGALHVWRVTDGAVEKVEVSLIRRVAGRVIVDGPLSEGDRIVVEGTQRLRAGRAVQVLNPPEEANT